MLPGTDAFQSAPVLCQQVKAEVALIKKELAAQAAAQEAALIRETAAIKTLIEKTLHRTTEKKRSQTRSLFGLPTR